MAILKERFLQRLQSGPVARGTWITFSDPAITEICAQAGFDFLVFDLEHAPLGIETLTLHLLALKGEATFPIVRVLWNEPFFVKQVLDTGAPGVMIPWVLTKEDAEKAVASCLYPGEGIRGFGPRRASQYGRKTRDYINRANQEVFCVLQIEHIKAVENLEAILSVPHIDAIFIGPWDLSGSLGILGQMDHPLLEEAITTIVTLARKHNLPVGIAAGTDLREVERLQAWGIRFATLGTDYGIFAAKLEELLEMFHVEQSFPDAEVGEDGL